VCLFGCCLPLWQLVPLVTFVAYQAVALFSRMCARRPNLVMTPISVAKMHSLIVRMFNTQADGVLSGLVSAPARATATSVTALHIKSADDYRALAMLTAREPKAVAIIKVGAPWCPPCRAIAPVVDSVAAVVHAKALRDAAAAIAAAPGNAFAASDYTEAAADEPTSMLGEDKAGGADGACCEGGVCEMRKKPASAGTPKPVSAPTACAEGEGEGDANGSDREDIALLASGAGGPAGASLTDLPPLPLLIVADINVDAVPELASLANLLPTFIILSRGVIADSFVGADRSKLAQAVQKHMFVDCRGAV